MLEVTARGGLGYILVCDLKNRQSFENIAQWAEKIDSDQAFILIVGTHSDLEKYREVTTSELNQLKDSINTSMKQANKKHVCIGTIEVSSKDCSNVSEAFREITHSILASLKNSDISISDSENNLAALKAEIQQHFGLKGNYTNNWFKDSQRNAALIKVSNLIKNNNNTADIIKELKEIAVDAQLQHELISGSKKPI